MDIVDRILELSEKQFPNDVEFAKAIGTKQQRISEWRNRESTSYNRFVSEIAVVLNVTTDYLYFGKNPGHDDLTAKEFQIIQAYRKADSHIQEIVDTTLAPFAPVIAQKKAT